jgi:hypothetical protein
MQDSVYLTANNVNALNPQVSVLNSSNQASSTDQRAASSSTSSSTSSSASSQQSSTSNTSGQKGVDTRGQDLVDVTNNISVANPQISALDSSNKSYAHQQSTTTGGQSTGGSNGGGSGSVQNSSTNKTSGFAGAATVQEDRAVDLTSNNANAAYPQVSALDSSKTSSTTDQQAGGGSAVRPAGNQQNANEASSKKGVDTRSQDLVDVTSNNIDNVPNPQVSALGSSNRSSATNQQAQSGSSGGAGELSLPQRDQPAAQATPVTQPVVMERDSEAKAVESAAEQPTTLSVPRQEGSHIAHQSATQIAGGSFPDLLDYYRHLQLGLVIMGLSFIPGLLGVRLFLEEGLHRRRRGWAT